MIGRGRGRGRGRGGARVSGRNMHAENGAKEMEQNQIESSSDDNWLEPETTSNNIDSNTENVELYIGNLPEKFTQTQDLYDHFIEFGEITSTNIKVKEDGYRFGFVYFKTMEQAQKAIKIRHFKPPHNLKVSLALKKKVDSSDTMSSCSSIQSHNSAERRNRHNPGKKLMGNRKNGNNFPSNNTEMSINSDQMNMHVETTMPACAHCTNQFVRCNCGKWYCNVDCQLADFPNHRLKCSVMDSGLVLEKQLNERKQESSNVELNNGKGLKEPRKTITKSSDLNCLNQIDKNNCNFTKAVIQDKNIAGRDPFARLIKLRENLKIRLSNGSASQENRVSEETVDSSSTNESLHDQFSAMSTEDNINTSPKTESTTSCFPDAEPEKELWEIMTELEIGEDVTVIVRHVDNFAWVTDVLNNSIISYIQQFTNYEANKDNPIKEIASGSLCLVNHEDQWYRAVVTSTMPSISVRLLEYGKTVNVSDMKKLVEVVDSDLRTEPPFAVKVLITPGSTIQFAEKKTYKIKPTVQIDDYFMVVVEGHEPTEDPKSKTMIKSPIELMQPKSEGTLFIEHRFCSDRATVTFETSAIEQITDLISTELRKYDTPQVDDFVLIKSTIVDKEWARGKVVKIIDGKYVVSLCDFGKIVHCDQVYHLPGNHISIAPQSCNLRVIKLLSKNYDKYMKFLKKVSYRVMQTIPHIEIICSTDDKSEDIFRAEVTPWSPNIGQYGPNLTSLAIAKTYKSVKLFEIQNINTVYIKNQDKDFCEKFDALIDTVKQYSGTLKAKPLIAMPVKHEMVLSLYPGDGNFYRAIVKEVRDKKHITVLYTEFGNDEVVSLDQLLELSDVLKSEPIYLLEVKLLGVPKEENENALAILRRSNQTFTLKIDDKLYPSVTLIYEDGTSLNDKLINFMSGSKVNLLNEITFLPINVGPNSKIYIVNTSQLKNAEIYVTVADIEGSNILHEILEEQHIELAEIYEKTNNFHTPLVNEVCVAKFPEDSWNRAVCVKIGFGTYANKFFVRNLDCGGMTWITKNHIRKIDPKFLKKPCVASKLAIEDIPKPLKPEQISVLKKYFEIGTQKSVTVELVADGDYTMKLPASVLREL